MQRQEKYIEREIQEEQNIAWEQSIYEDAISDLYLGIEVSIRKRKNTKNKKKS